ncbi:hypothetical protein L2E82_09067 [Cichorium intybus]|uniref:Uncharacterized protein n=1 Tax=Cichorium intybus TaxID=13427 RepID=A0ACB9G822_CICIN|nr:hypothetical protein L2E82_09067 [Cichorium intybus]
MHNCFLFFGSSKPQVKSENDRRKPLVIIKDNDYDTAAAGDELHNPTAAMALILQSWLNGHRLRYLILVLFSPLLIPFLCAIFPFLCAAEVFFRFCRRRRSKPAHPQNPLPPTVRRRQHDVEGGRQAKSDFSLLDRYLDDQLELAIEILHECGGDLGYGYDYVADFGNRSNNLC